MMKTNWIKFWAKIVFWIVPYALVIGAAWLLTAAMKYETIPLIMNVFITCVSVYGLFHYAYSTSQEKTVRT